MKSIGWVKNSVKNELASARRQLWGLERRKHHNPTMADEFDYLINSRRFIVNYWETRLAELEAIQTLDEGGDCGD